MSMICKEYLNSVVSIGTYDKNGNKFWNGTGFFITKLINKKEAAVYLVTNKHVVLGFDKIFISMKDEITSEFKNIEFIVKDNPKFHYHEDKNVDLVCIEIDQIFVNGENFHFYCFNIDENAMTTDELIENGVDQGNLIYLLGFPLQLVNKNQNPLCRLGCIARMDKEEIELDKSFYIDVQNFGGNSGGPVIVRPEVVGIENTKVFNKSILIGIVKTCVMIVNKIINPKTNEEKIIPKENSGIAEVIPVEYIKQIIDKNLSK